MSYRVIQWATGQCGRMVVRALATHPELELVGVRTWDPAKAGRDAGEIAGIRPIGVLASDDFDELMEIDADCHIYMGDVASVFTDEGIAEICRVLESGKNVVSIVHTWLLSPAHAPAEWREVIERACAAGDSTFYVTGMEPGFVNEVLAPVLTSICHRVDLLETRELLNYAEWRSPMLFTLMPFGREPAPGQMELLEEMTPLFAAPLHSMAEALGIELDEIRFAHDHAVSPDDFDVAMGHVAAGTIGAVRFSWTGYVDGVARVKTEHINRLRDDLAPEWVDSPIDAHGYEVRIKGDPSFDVTLDFRPNSASAVQTALMTTAMRAVNSVPAVCDAPAGLLTAAELRQIAGKYTVRPALDDHAVVAGS